MGLCSPFLLWCYCLLLMLPETTGHDRREKQREGGEQQSSQSFWADFSDLKKHLKIMTALSRRYWAYFSCRVWPQDCKEKEKATSEALGWSLPLLGQQYLEILSTWYCRFQDCCASGDCRITNNVTGLESDLSTRLHGQHLARHVVPKAVRNFLASPQPEKALALSFHGWSGTGKNFVARMLADNLYRDGLESECVKVFISLFHFPHPRYVDLYQKQLKQHIVETVGRCRQALFVFDEAEKLHPSLLDTLSRYLHHHHSTKEQDCRKAIFLFLSNLGGNTINELVLSFLQTGQPREEITLESLEQALRAELLASADSGFGRSSLVKDNLIDFFVPFLPLEFRHVRLCARDAFQGRGLQYGEEALDEIARMMVYVPKEQKLFSAQGCKSIAQRINYFLP
ncbi:torsin-3A [Tachyglossus aculeatus]|uniref:torsin-3A n=1 Tax=Tachyglossus aculeatus TaxID=9261 RepID=UPI0018F3902B|nr:torsin-3A [Tachyglossus aculeatus]